MIFEDVCKFFGKKGFYGRVNIYFVLFINVMFI